MTGRPFWPLTRLEQRRRMSGCDWIKPGKGGHAFDHIMRIRRPVTGKRPLTAQVKYNHEWNRWYRTPRRVAVLLFNQTSRGAKTTNSPRAERTQVCWRKRNPPKKAPVSPATELIDSRWRMSRSDVNAAIRAHLWRASRTAWLLKSSDETYIASSGTGPLRNVRAYLLLFVNPGNRGKAVQSVLLL